MYPSKSNAFYGVFTQNFYQHLLDNPHFKAEKIVISQKTTNYALKLLVYLKFYADILCQLLIRKYDLVYVHNVTHSVPVLRLIYLFKKNNLVFNFHGEDLLTKTRLSSILLSIAKPLLIKAQLIVVPSQFFKEEVQKQMPVNPKQIFISPSGGIDLNIFKPLNVKKKSENFTIGYVSRIDRGKGWDILLSAVHLYMQHNNDVPLSVIVVGNGAELPLFFKMLENYQLQDVVQYVGGVEQSQLPLIYSRMDVFIFPTTLHESLGLVGLEAMACGVPVIGSEIGGLKGFIKNSYNGYFFKPGDSTDLLEKIVALWNLRKEEKQKLQQNAVETAQQYDGKKSMEILLNKLCEVYQKS